MEAEFQDFTDQMFPCKGKRTKRPRALSSIGVAIDSPSRALPFIGVAVDSSPSGDGPTVGVAVDSSPLGDGDGGCGDYYYSSVVHSPASSSSQISTATEEDENMANCLILLARSGCPKQDASNDVKVEKITCQKFSGGTAAIATATSVYECKTCNRKFPSFQALGGHRASHSKPKLIPENHKKTTPSDHHHHHHHHDRDQDNHEEIQHKIHKKTKTHECSVCGSEFYSGQALGGHMRRHRPLHINTTTNMKASIDENQEKPRPVFTLDLNLPAPDEDEVDDENNTMFEFSAKQQQSSAFSCPAFVDCHY